MKTGSECIYSKTRFATKKDAEVQIKKLAEVSVRTTIPSRAYLCSCNSWHLTSIADSYETLKIKQLEADIKKLKAENALLASDRNKEDRITLKVDLRVTEANARALMFEKSEKSLKNEVNYLIVRKIALENQLKKMSELSSTNYFRDSEMYFSSKNSHLPR